MGIGHGQTSNIPWKPHHLISFEETTLGSFTRYAARYEAKRGNASKQENDDDDDDEGEKTDARKSMNFFT